MIITYGDMETSRKEILDFCLAKKQENPNYKVVDVGGTAAAWSQPVANLVIDFNATDSDTAMKADITSYEDWQKIIAYVEANGMFDYAICTHTLEDVANPFLALKNLPKIAKAGIITMPSMKTEMTNVESPTWIGYIHHRWFFSKENDIMFVVPKLSVFETLAHMNPNPPAFDKANSEVRYHWENEIPYKVFMDGYHGPTARHVLDCCLGVMQYP